VVTEADGYSKKQVTDETLERPEANTLQPRNRTDASFLKALLLKKTKYVNGLSCGVKVSWEQVESRRKKLMFYIHESIWNGSIYLSAKTSQTGCLTAALPSHRT